MDIISFEFIWYNIYKYIDERTISKRLVNACIHYVRVFWAFARALPGPAGRRSRSHRWEDIKLLTQRLSDVMITYDNLNDNQLKFNLLSVEPAFPLKPTLPPGLALPLLLPFPTGSKLRCRPVIVLALKHDSDAEGSFVACAQCSVAETMQLRKPDGVFPKTFQHCPRSSGSLERWKSLLSKTVTLQAQCESLWVRQALSCNLPALIAQSLLALLREHHVNHCQPCHKASQSPSDQDGPRPLFRLIDSFFLLVFLLTLIPWNFDMPGASKIPQSLSVVLCCISKLSLVSFEALRFLRAPLSYWGGGPIALESCSWRRWAGSAVVVTCDNDNFWQLLMGRALRQLEPAKQQLHGECIIQHRHNNWDTFWSRAAASNIAVCCEKLLNFWANFFLTLAWSAKIP